MNRRTFLKSIAAVCGAAVVCPGELLKSPAQRVYGAGWYDFNPFGSEAERKKYRQNIFVKARQQGITTKLIIDKHNHYLSFTKPFTHQNLSIHIC